VSKIPPAVRCALLGLLLLTLPAAARAHQCVDVEILESPDLAHPGQLIHVTGWIKNCGDPARGFRTGWVLVDQMGDRIQLAGGPVQLEPGEAESETVRLLLPDRLRPGIYQLVLVAQTPTGFTDSYGVRLAIRPARGGQEG
jgi:hypothetical protein